MDVADRRPTNSILRGIYAACKDPAQNSSNSGKATRRGTVGLPPVVVQVIVGCIGQTVLPHE